MIQEQDALASALKYLWGGKKPTYKKHSIRLSNSREVVYDFEQREIWVIVIDYYDPPGWSLHSDIVYVDAATGVTWLLGETPKFG